MTMQSKQLVFAIWLATLICGVGFSVVSDARWSTTAAVFVLLLAPMCVALLLGLGSTRSMTTHELLHSVDQPKNGRL